MSLIISFTLSGPKFVFTETWNSSQLKLINLTLSMGNINRKLLIFATNLGTSNDQQLPEIKGYE